MKQSEELALIADSLDPKVSRIYTSPSYRCVQTITPLAGRMPHVPIIVDQGLGDWFGKALVEYPPPPDLQTLRRFFPKLTEQSSYAIPRYGEGLEEVHDRVAYVLARIIADADVACTLDRPEAIIISTHAAVLITMGRALTGRVPEDRTEKDFDTYTCSVSTYKRKQQFSNQDLKVWKLADPVPKFAWRGNGVGGGWNCTVNAGVQHLTNGGERNW